MEDRHPWDQAPPRRRVWKSFVALTHRLFPERQLMVRTEGRISYLRISRRFQISTATCAAVVVGWVAYASTSFFIHDAILETKERDVASARLAYTSLLDEVSQYQSKFSDVTNDLVQNHNLMLKLVEQNATLQQSLKTVASKLEDTEQDRETVVATRERLRGELKSVEDRMKKLVTQNFSLEKNVASLKSNLNQVAQERTSAVSEGNGLKDRVKDLENILADLQETEKSILLRVSEHTTGRIAAIEDVLNKTGLNLETVLAKNGDSAGMGGPFIAANQDEAVVDDELRTTLVNLDTQVRRWNNLQGLMNSLPLFPPLDYYYVTSAYGKRRDPVNRKWAMHYGLDLGSSLNAPVYTAADGTVTHAGWKGKYGKLVEIDHGNGVVSRYGHLAKVLVQKGVKISQRTKIGLVGSTGRSTGAHLHYEINVNGKTVNPRKFIQAGKYVFKG